MVIIIIISSSVLFNQYEKQSNINILSGKVDSESILNVFLINSEESLILFENSENDNLGLIKTNSKKEIVFEKKYNVENYSTERVMIREKNDGFIIFGETNYDKSKIISRKPWIMMIDQKGNLKWKKKLELDYTSSPYAIDLSNDSIVLAIQLTDGPNNTTVIKFDNKGNSIWEKNIGTARINSISSINITKDNTIVMGGYIESLETLKTTQSDFWIVQLDSLGNLEWEKVIGGKELSFYPEVTIINDQEYIVVGDILSTDTKKGSISVSKINSNGKVLWEKLIDSQNIAVYTSSPTSSMSVEKNSIIILYTMIINQEEKISLLELDLDGKIINEKILTNEGNNSLKKLRIINGNYFLTGYNFKDTWDEENAKEWIMKLDKNYNIKWKKEILEYIFN